MRFLLALGTLIFFFLAVPGCSAPSSDESIGPSTASEMPATTEPMQAEGTVYRRFPAAAPLARFKAEGWTISHRGIDGAGDMWVVFTKPDGRWHIAYLKPGGLICPVIFGDGWQEDKGQGT